MSPLHGSRDTHPPHVTHEPTQPTQFSRLLRVITFLKQRFHKPTYKIQLNTFINWLQWLLSEFVNYTTYNFYFHFSLLHHGILYDKLYTESFSKYFDASIKIIESVRFTW